MANETMTHEGRTEPDFTAQTVLDATVLAGAHLSATLDCVVGRSELAAPSPALECVLTFAARADLELAATIRYCRAHPALIVMTPRNEF